jgi:hypothetical protein
MMIAAIRFKTKTEVLMGTMTVAIIMINFIIDIQLIAADKSDFVPFSLATFVVIFLFPGNVNLRLGYIVTVNTTFVIRY